MTMHYAKLENSPRLQKLLKLLQDEQRHSTLDIIQRTGICAVSSGVSELRRNGFVIGQEQVKRNLHEYWLIPIPADIPILSLPPEDYIFGKNNKELF